VLTGHSEKEKGPIKRKKSWADFGGGSKTPPPIFLNRKIFSIRLVVCKSMSLVQPASHRPCAYCAHTFFLKSSAYFYSKILIATREVLLFILNFETKKKKKEKRKKKCCFFSFLLSPNFGPYFLSQCHCVRSMYWDAVIGLPLIIDMPLKIGAKNQI